MDLDSVVSISSVMNAARLIWNQSATVGFNLCCWHESGAVRFNRFDYIALDPARFNQIEFIGCIDLVSHLVQTESITCAWVQVLYLIQVWWSGCIWFVRAFSKWWLFMFMFLSCQVCACIVIQENGVLRLLCGTLFPTYLFALAADVRLRPMVPISTRLHVSCGGDAFAGDTLHWNQLTPWICPRSCAWRFAGVACMQCSTHQNSCLIAKQQPNRLQTLFVCCVRYINNCLMMVRLCLELYGVLLCLFLSWVIAIPQVFELGCLQLCVCTEGSDLPPVSRHEKHICICISHVNWNVIISVWERTGR